MQIRCNNCFCQYEEAYGLCPNCGYMEGEGTTEAYGLNPGTKLLGRYIIGEIVGIGGFGITYKAWDLQLEKILAIKEYFPSGLVNRTSAEPTVFLVAHKREKEFIYGKQRFLDEARNTAKFSKHRNIVNVYDCFEANNTVYMVMEYLDGMTLSKAIQTEGKPMSVERCVSIAIDMCDALEAIHKESILHRDVSPDNIMLCKDGTVKLFDFGAARFSVDAAVESKVTIIVKPGFAPPEQYNKINKQDGRTDIYALGATLYYALTGVKPEESTNRIVEDTLIAPQTLMPSIPTYVNNAIIRAMAVEAQYRFDDVKVLKKVFQEKKDVGTVGAERKRRLKNRMLGIASAMLVLAIAAGVFIYQWNNQQIPNGNIKVWYTISGDTVADQKIESSWKAIVDQFMMEYEGVTVEALGIPEAEYADKIADAQSKGTMPDVYEVSNLPESVTDEAKDLKTVLKRSSGSYMEGVEDTTKYPTGIILPAIYVNTSIGSIQEARDFAEMVTACTDFGSKLVVSEESVSLFTELYDADVSVYSSNTALNQFVNGECVMYLGTTADYLVAQQLMRNGKGRYTILFPETDKALYSYGTMWSLNKTGKKTEKIAEVMLEFLNTNMAQDYFNIQNFAQSGCMPVTEVGLKNFLMSNEELKGAVTYLELPYGK